MSMLACRFAHDDGGATSIEYAMIASIVSIAIVAAVLGLGAAVKGDYVSVQNALN